MTNELTTAVAAPFEAPAEGLTASSLMLNDGAMDRIYKFASTMAAGVATVPKHLQGNIPDCFAVCTQAQLWGMNPFAVAQKTHIGQSGALGYESQLVNAVVTTKAPVKDRFHYEFLGNWNKILGKVEERKSDKGGKYYVATWKPADEEGLGVIIRCTLKGENEPRELQLMMSQAFPRFSTQWATDPQQQIGYLAVRKWARRYTPDVLLGVYVPEELSEIPVKHMGAAELVPIAVPQHLLDAAEAAAIKGLSAYQSFWTHAGKDSRTLLADRHAGLKDTAIQADKSRTFDAATVDTPSAPLASKTVDADGVIDAAFVAAMGGDEASEE